MYSVIKYGFLKLAFGRTLCLAAMGGTGLPVPQRWVWEGLLVLTVNLSIMECFDSLPVGHCTGFCMVKQLKVVL